MKVLEKVAAAIGATNKTNDLEMAKAAIAALAEELDEEALSDAKGANWNEYVRTGDNYNSVEAAITARLKSLAGEV